MKHGLLLLFVLLLCAVQARAADSLDCRFASYNHVPGVPQDIRVVGGIACIATGGTGLYIVDVSDPANPESLSVTAMPNSCTGVDIDGSYAYVAGQDHFSSVDISDPTNLVEVGHYSRPSVGFISASVNGHFVCESAWADSSGVCHLVLQR